MSALMTRQEVVDHQLSALQHLLREIAHANPFWRPRLTAAGLAAGCPSLDVYRQQLPPVTKAELVDDQRAHPPFGSNLTYPLQHYVRFNQTSATSGGAPLRWLDTAPSWQWMLDNWKQVYQAAGVTNADRIYFAFSFGPFLGFWTAYGAATQLGCLALPGGGLSSAARLAAMRDNHATVLCCTPTYARRLAEVARRDAFDMSQLEIETIIVAGEPGGSVPAVRAAIEREWPTARVFDHHGMTEVGPVSYEAPDKAGTLVVIESSYLAEIVDPVTRVPVVPGQVGELLLTTLGRLGSPLLRYRTGDLVREDTTPLADLVGPPFLRLAGGILGRADDMVVVRGVNVYPSAVADICASFQEIVEYQVTIRRTGTMVEMTLDIEPDPEISRHDEIVKRVADEFKSRLALTVPVNLQPPGTLPRHQMKSRRWQCL